MVRTTIDAQIARIRKQRAFLDKREKDLLAKTKNKFLDRIVEIARTNGISAAQIAEALKANRKPRTKSAKKSTAARGKVAPKYRNPADAAQTWTGRGKMPLWVKALSDAGNLESARIAPAA